MRTSGTTCWNAPHRSPSDEPPKRGWQALFDTLNELKAYAYLQRLGCSQVAFI
jgi:hypothetical protein